MEKSNKKILVVEDESAVNYALSLKFNLIKGVELFFAKDGEQGLNMALEKKPDLILLDIIMPKMDGIEMLKKLRQDNWGKNVKVIILSNLSHTDREREARELGVEDYIIKAEWELEEVVKLVESKL